MSGYCTELIAATLNLHSLLIEVIRWCSLNKPSHGLKVLMDKLCRSGCNLCQHFIQC